MSFSRTAVIRASPDRVFSVLSDLDQSRQWMPAIERIDNVTPGAFRQGTSWQETRKAGKRTMQSMLSVESFDPPKRLGLHVEGKVMKGDMSFSLSPKAGGTEVTYDAQMWGKGLMRLMTGMMNRMMAEEDNDILERLRSQVEGAR
jgi:carbon monoxide dehydrogenase subunit G